MKSEPQSHQNINNITIQVIDLSKDYHIKDVSAQKCVLPFFAASFSS